MWPDHTKNSAVSQSRTKEIRTLSVDGGVGVEPSGKFLVYKHRGETLAALLRRFRVEQSIDRSVPITYAGRLDPMAEGVVLLLVGAERHKKDALLALTKTYEVEILFGIGTDTQDVLGLVVDEQYRSITPLEVAQVLECARSLTELPYPLYSSVIVEGKPLFAHTRAGTVVVPPTKHVTITDTKLLHTRVVPLEIVAREAIEDIGKVEGDFRQLAIMKEWRARTHSHPSIQVLIATVRVSASSGTYMRSLAAWIGTQLGVPALAYKIKRTKIGEWGI